MYEGADRSGRGMTAMVRMATLKLEGETENMGVCTKERQGVPSDDVARKFG